jgi:hypothetical protein
VSWDNDGAPVLRFVAPGVSDAWLAAAGFDRVYADGSTSVHPRWSVPNASRNACRLRG